MKATELMNVLEGRLLSGELPDEEIEAGCGSDMMSDVLAFSKDKMVLLTGLTNTHVVRTCEMLDVLMIVFVRGKTPGADVLEMAEDRGMTIAMTDFSLYEACGKLYSVGLKGYNRR